MPTRMHLRPWVVLPMLCLPGLAAAFPLGLVDARHPAPPVNVPDGGPLRRNAG